MDGSKALSSFFFLLFSTAHTGSCTLNSFSIDPLDQALGNVCNFDIKLLLKTSLIRLKTMKLGFIFDIMKKKIVSLDTSALSGVKL